MEYKELLQELKKLNLPLGEYAITSSGPLAVRGIRETADIDIIVSEKLWETISEKYPADGEESKRNKITIGNIEVLGGFSSTWSDEEASIQKQIETADIIGGFPFVKLEFIKRFKQRLGRDKDLKDIELINQYLVNSL